MNSRKNIQRELELYNSSLPFDVRMPVFDLPEGYFENFAAAVLANIKGQTIDATGELAALSPLLASLSKKTPYALPEGYFATAFAPATAIEEDPVPAWNAGARTMPYTVPVGYFDQLPATTLKAVLPAGGAKLISMGARNWMRYAAAAVLVGILVLGALLYNGNGSSSNPADPQGWVATQLRNVSNQELEAFILATGINEGEPAQQTASNQRDVQKLLRDVPSSELDAFLSGLPAGTEQIN